ncbi:hypothetical protein GUJ93_ZPchr0009g918 [Zizania palustris]|uniref:Uncharacterized protein n=1 Tax=Zizania palustris TaxID=103762 RepID=A0A8J5V3A6_ZIZPA|nr:hypothetical protein GUJ93_ZPchr0009g918 [Zizania palustris]
MEGPAVADEALEEDDLDAEHDDAPLRLRAMNDALGDAQNPGYARRHRNRLATRQLDFDYSDEPAIYRLGRMDNLLDNLFLSIAVTTGQCCLNNIGSS